LNAPNNAKIMNILEKITAHKKTEIATRKKEMPVSVLEQSAFFKRQPFSMKQFLLDDTKTGIIAEFKRKSPSKGIINDTADVAEVTLGYTNHGASALSVLTDEHFFGGSLRDLELARTNAIPVLRKDFMIDAYQVVEAKANGADVILLIAACLSPLEVKQLAATAKSLGLEVLLEIHGEDELEHICDDVDIVGVNNRDLKTFSVDISRSVALGGKIPAGKLKISESGISNVDNILHLRKFGFKGFLIGEHFMRENDPVIAFAGFVNGLKDVVLPIGR
jgi:indole-3-glycerol phosphate synthase